MPANDAMKVLIVEDESEVVELLSAYFETKGYQVFTAEDGVHALERFQDCAPDLIILDIVLPRLDGWKVLEAVRARSKIPVIMLTALNHTDDVVKGLSLGADDYLGKPFQVRELDARMQAVLRRVSEQVQSAMVRVGPIEIDDRAKSVRLNGKPVSLSPKEYELLKLLASDVGRVFSTDEILHHLWSDSGRATAADVKQYVHLVRNKIEGDRRDPQRIKTVKGFGYKLVI